MLISTGAPHRKEDCLVSDVDPVDLDRLGHAIRVRRRALNLSQNGVARSSGIHRNYIGALERGEVNPTYGTLLRLARGLRMPLDQLIANAQGRGEPFAGRD
ncbi:helix-turn-helix transcriptional regulator [Conexibacter sp. JD483]|uniref:helix-turn-helix domain-containing protein n=1 Tax=unclassified Conexibacter TaxID=2627773 RepID=UPI00271EAC6C|nr:MULTISPECIES: helix-turn-helix transcriptional regulator [unclassified Conexibacter]MDO8187282.1 helix-turn-helix transcriptional regulator [Conexibacter sp. CPCC 205706]MDO8198891.1 helix-turn-helix transcriptional regulator [Conexibacter sp. CPCC 205762]MDR9370630.1 helix-turn-helix transcriptional regulator [Conexibacter sp. JD483]